MTYESDYLPPAVSGYSRFSRIEVTTTTASDAASIKIRRELRKAKLTFEAIDAAWPEWWSAEAESSPAAVAELRYTLARRLGLAPQSLFDGSPVFLWQDDAKFKRLSVDGADKEALTSFGVTLGRIVVAAAPPPDKWLPDDPLQLRAAILDAGGLVNLKSLLALSWAFGIPVIQPGLLPTAKKGMHAMSVRIGERFAIVIGQSYSFRSRLAYVLAHEMGHCLLGHLSGADALVEMSEPKVGAPANGDAEEIAADQFALTLLTGSPTPVVEASIADYTATQLAHAADARAADARVEPGVLALCLAHATGRWRQTSGALKILEGRVDLASLLNNFAWRQLNLDAISHDSAVYLGKVLPVRA